MVRLYLAICSEIDVVLKELCKEITFDFKGQNINEYRRVIVGELKGFSNQKVICYKFDLEFTSWEAWSEKSSPRWWSEHNKVKHQRNEFYNKANLRNVLESLAALYIVNLYLAFVRDKKLNQGFISSIDDTIPKLPVKLDLFCIKSLYTSIREY